MIGVAFQNLQGAENIGFIIPVPIIKHFLKDIELNNQYVGFCDLGLTCQALENPHFQRIMRLKPEQIHTGVVINAVHRVHKAHLRFCVSTLILLYVCALPRYHPQMVFCASTT